MSQILEQDPLEVARLELPKCCLVLIAPCESLGATVIYKPEFYPPNVHKHVYIYEGLQRDVSKLSDDQLGLTYMYVLLGCNLLRGPFSPCTQRPVNKPPVQPRV